MGKYFGTDGFRGETWLEPGTARRDMVHFSQSKISKIERGDWDSLSDLRLIAKALECSD